MSSLWDPAGPAENCSTGAHIEFRKCGRNWLWATAELTSWCSHCVYVDRHECKLYSYTAAYNVLFWQDLVPVEKWVVLTTTRELVTEVHASLCPTAHQQVTPQGQTQTYTDSILIFILSKSVWVWQEISSFSGQCICCSRIHFFISLLFKVFHFQNLCFENYYLIWCLQKRPHPTLLL